MRIGGDAGLRGCAEWQRYLGVAGNLTAAGNLATLQCPVRREMSGDTGLPGRRIGLRLLRTSRVAGKKRRRCPEVVGSGVAWRRGECLMTQQIPGDTGRPARRASRASRSGKSVAGDEPARRASRASRSGKSVAGDEPGRRASRASRSGKSVAGDEPGRNSSRTPTHKKAAPPFELPLRKARFLVRIQFPGLQYVSEGPP